MLTEQCQADSLNEDYNADHKCALFCLHDLANSAGMLFHLLRASQAQKPHLCASRASKYVMLVEKFPGRLD